MDKERLLIKGHLLILIGGVEDKGVQEKIVQELEATEAKFPDGKLKMLGKGFFVSTRIITKK
jgi:hypothetical protein